MKSLTKRTMWVIAAYVLLAVALATFSRLPGGICFHDAGGLQLASATLGITHPPGYVIYATINHLISWIVPVDPALIVNVFCWLSCLAAFALGIVLQGRVGGHIWIAGATTLAILLHPAITQNYLEPEVYAPSLFFMVAAIFLWTVFLETKRMGLLYVAIVLFAIVWVSRPPMILILPFLILSYRLAGNNLWPRNRKQWAHAALVAVCALAPFVYTFAYLVIRDSPGTAYNYLEQYDLEHDALPAREESFAASAQRAIWHASAAQFRGNVRVTFWSVVSRLRWVRNQTLPDQPSLFIVILLIASLGLMQTWRRNRAVAVMLLGMGFASLAFVSLYRVHDTAADLLPFLFALGTLLGLGLSSLAARFLPKKLSFFQPVLFCLMIALTFARGYFQYGAVSDVDARHFVEGTRMESIPEGAVILTGWFHAPPLWYAQHVLYKRHDLKIICADRARWVELAAKFPGRSIVAVSESSPEEPFRSHAYGPLWVWDKFE